MPASDNKDLIGIDTKIKEIISRLNIGTKDSHILGIWGTGGIGKTTLAKAVYSKISWHFEGHSFIHNVREEFEQGGLNRLREQLFSTVLGDRNMNMGAFIVRQHNLNRLRRKNILIVFDDVSNFGQIESLIENLKSLNPQSRIIITSRDKQVLKNCGVNQWYEVQKLLHHEALELFQHYAFKGNNPKKYYIELSERVVGYAGGIPLALKILGSSLFDKSKEVWDDKIEKLEKIIDRNIQKVLEISYHELDDEEKKIFLDIALFFKGNDVRIVKQFFDACGFSGKELAISTLIDKSLIAISFDMIKMHDLIQAMAKEIVRKESIDDPGKRSRLWYYEDIYSVLTKNTGTETIEGISLDVSKVKAIKLNPLAFSKMQKLRVLNFYSSCWSKMSRVNVVNDIESDFTELKYLHWHEYPLTSLSSNFCPQNLAILEMPYSNVTQLWDGVQVLPNLKKMDFSYSTHLTCIPDLSQAPNLESLTFFRCTSLTEIPSSIQHLVKLAYLNLNFCANLRKFPTSSDAIKHLRLGGCSNLEAFPITSSMEVLDLKDTAVEVLPSNFEKLSRLRLLNLHGCSRLTCLPDSICRLTSLEILDISGCSKLDGLPEEVGNLENLESLRVDRVPIKKIPSSMSRLKNLVTLSIQRSKSQEQPSLQLPPLLEFHHLDRLYLAGCGITELPESLGLLSSVQNLTLSGNNLESIPESIIHLSRLRDLDISYCERLLSLPELPRSLHRLYAVNCKSLQALSNLSTLPTKLNFLSFINCFNLNRNAIRDIVQNFLLKFLSKECAHDDDDVSGLGDRINFPGDEIPEWFRSQCLGSSILFKLPPNWFNDDFLGFGLCIIVGFYDHLHNGHSLYAGFDCEVKLPDGESFLLTTDGFFGAWNSPENFGPSYVGGDHVLLNFFEVQRGDFCGNGKHFSDEISFRFYIETLHCATIKPTNTCKVKKCGVRLMYKQDFVDSGESFNFDDSFGNQQKNLAQAEDLDLRRRSKRNQTPRG